MSSSLMEERLDALSQRLSLAPHESVSVHRFMEAFSPFERDFLTLLFIVPFLQPIPVWGVSSVLGVLLALMHGSLAIRGPHSPLPARVLRFELEGRRLQLLVRGALYLVGRLDRFFRRPPGGPFCSSFQKRFAAAGEAMLAIFLSLPLPIPFSNSLPALGLLLFSVAFIAENRRLLFLGYLLLLANIVSFALLAVLPFWGISTFM